MNFDRSLNIIRQHEIYSTSFHTRCVSDISILRKSHYNLAFYGSNINANGMLCAVLLCDAIIYPVIIIISISRHIIAHSVRPVWMPAIHFIFCKWRYRSRWEERMMMFSHTALRMSIYYIRTIYLYVWNKYVEELDNRARLWQSMVIVISAICVSSTHFVSLVIVQILISSYPGAHVATNFLHKRYERSPSYFNTTITTRVSRNAERL